MGKMDEIQRRVVARQKKYRSRVERVKYERKFYQRRQRPLDTNAVVASDLASLVQFDLATGTNTFTNLANAAKKDDYKPSFKVIINEKFFFLNLFFFKN